MIHPDDYWHPLEPLAYVEYCLASAVDAYNSPARSGSAVQYWFLMAHKVARARLTRDEWIAAINRIEPA